MKLKIKVCSGGAFQDFMKLQTVPDKHDGTFGGSFKVPPAGIYELRATLYVHGDKVARSDKRHFVTR